MVKFQERKGKVELSEMAFFNELSIITLTIFCKIIIPLRF